jgi:hypothetical protein
MDDEMLRLRRLQSCAMRVIAIDEALSGQGGAEARRISLAGIAARRVARIVHDVLIRHPNLRYRRGIGRWERCTNRAVAFRAKTLHPRKSGAARIMQDALNRMSRQVDDVRALTWSQELSDRLARIQVELRSVAISPQPSAGGSDFRPSPDGTDCAPSSIH